MKLADIKTGQRYAIGSPNSDWDIAVHEVIRITERKWTPVTGYIYDGETLQTNTGSRLRPVREGSRFEKGTRYAVIKVERSVMFSRDNEREVVEVLVPASNVLRTAADQAELEAEKAQYQSEREAYEARQANTLEAVQATLDEAGLSGSLRFNTLHRHGGGMRTDHGAVVINLSDLKKLVDLAAKASGN